MRKKQNSPKTPYVDRPDIDKLRAQWTKLSGHHDSNQQSAAIVRCAAAAEIAANIAVRQEFSARGVFQSDVVDSFLLWANGIQGKMQRLVLPLCFALNKSDPDYKALDAASTRINAKRNKIVHSGHFATRREAEKLIADCKLFVETLVGRYHLGFTVD